MISSRVGFHQPRFVVAACISIHWGHFWPRLRRKLERNSLTPKAPAQPPVFVCVDKLLPHVWYIVMTGNHQSSSAKSPQSGLFHSLKHERFVEHIKLTSVILRISLAVTFLSPKPRDFLVAETTSLLIRQIPTCSAIFSIRAHSSMKRI